MKNLIDVNRLNYLIAKGQDSYSDGREEFTYELLCDLMKRLKVKIFVNEDHNFIKPKKKRYSKPCSWHRDVEWQIVVTSTYDWMLDESDDDLLEDTHDKGFHIKDKHYSREMILRYWRMYEPQRKNPYEEWEIRLVRKIKPRLP